MIGIGGLIEPRALGVGYDVIDQLLTGRATASQIVGILVLKTVIWSLSLGSGTSGGVMRSPLTGIVFALAGVVSPSSTVANRPGRRPDPSTASQPKRT